MSQAGYSASGCTLKERGFSIVISTRWCASTMDCNWTENASFHEILRSEIMRSIIVGMWVVLPRLRRKIGSAASPCEEKERCACKSYAAESFARVEFHDRSDSFERWFAAYLNRNPILLWRRLAVFSVEPIANPQTVSNQIGFVGSDSIFSRRRFIWTETVEVVPMESRSHIRS